MSPFDELGGEERLRAIIDRFVDRLFDDAMIGFFFARANRARIKQKEYEHAAEHLGASAPYTGRPIDEAHAAHPIRGGHFMRRVQILRQTLEEMSVPPGIRERCIEHTLALRPLVTGDEGGRCDEPTAGRAPEGNGS